MEPAEVEYKRSSGIGIIHIVIAAMWGAIGMVLDYLATLFTIGYGMVVLYPGAAAMAVGGIWHGPWAALGFYIGTVTGGILGGGVIPVQLIGPGLIAVIETLIPFVAFKLLKADASLRNWKGWAVFIAFGAVIPMVVTATWYIMVSMGFGLITWEIAQVIWIWWVISETITILIFAPPILLVGTKAAMKSRGYVKGWIT